MGSREDDEIHPLKKRRGLAGTIMSTVINAALIGSAVGLTVYRLWRNRGKLPEEKPQIDSPQYPLPPPPPYDAPSHHKPPQLVHHLPTSPKKPRHAQLSRQNKRPTTHHRRKKSHRSHPDHHHHHSLTSSSDPYFPTSSTRSEFDLDRESHKDGVEQKMDWIGDKLGMLIEQGKRALDTQVVVSSDVKEDEVDDGSDAWEEDENDINSRHPRSRSGSVRHCKRPKTLNLGPGPSTSSTSPRFADFNFPVSSSVPNTSFVSARFNAGYPGLPTSHSTTSLNNVCIEDCSTFESPELRESMERARQRMMARKLAG